MKKNVFFPFGSSVHQRYTSGTPAVHQMRYTNQMKKNVFFPFVPSVSKRQHSGKSYAANGKKCFFPFGGGGQWKKNIFFHLVFGTPAVHHRYTTGIPAVTRPCPSSPLRLARLPARRYAPQPWQNLCFGVVCLPSLKSVLIFPLPGKLRIDCSYHDSWFILALIFGKWAVLGRTPMKLTCSKVLIPFILSQALRKSTFCYISKPLDRQLH